ncbi:MAG: glycosyltransferase family 39 protein [Desulfobulbaceae bacterium]|nr:glycosyltransferase family 39 protein [Desulfobulbaceae bacterium]
MPPPPSENPIHAQSNWSWLPLVIIVIGSAYLRWHLLDVPLERDEGEYAYGGQLLLQGVPPYKLLFNMKLPGIYAVYAAILAIFGQTQTGVHLGLLTVNSLSIIVVYFLGRKIANPLVGLCAGGLFAVLSMGQSVQGVFANAEHFVLLPALIGLLLLLFALESERPLLFCLSGILLGTGFLIKQHGALFALWGGIYLVLHGRHFRKRPGNIARAALFFVGGTALPYLATCLLLWKAGLFDAFWFWTIDYARAYTSQISWSDAWLNITDRGIAIISAAPLIWLAAVLGLFTCLAQQKFARHRGFMLGFALFSFLAVCPGLFFRPHYFIFLLPGAALLAGIAIHAATMAFYGRQTQGKHFVVTFSILAICVGATLYHQRQFLFQFSPAQASRDTYWPNPFNESLDIARYIRTNSKPADTIAIIGSEPQIFFYSGRRSATGYIYMYPLMEGHDFALEMQRRLIAEVEQSQPEYLLFVRIPTSWLQKPASKTLIYDWFTEYKEGYQRVGMVEIFERSSNVSWTPNTHWPPTTPYWIEILRKKTM